MFSIQEIKELIEWVAANRVRGIEVERSGFKLKIDGVAPPEVHFTAAHAPAPALHAAHPAPPAYSHAAVLAAPAAAASEARGGGAALATPLAPAVIDEEGLHEILSPIVGTFYRSPGPDQDAFVKLGDHVTKGQTLCIVEAMKLMNEIEADVSGEIVKIFAQNVQPVEYGEKLFAIRPD